MTQVYVDPVKLSAFAHSLKGFATLTRSDASQLGRRLGKLHESWRDGEYEKFAAEFKKSAAHFNELAQIIDELALVLEEDARRAAEIHKSKL